MWPNGPTVVLTIWRVHLYVVDGCIMKIAERGKVVDAFHFVTFTYKAIAIPSVGCINDRRHSYLYFHFSAEELASFFVGTFDKT